MTGILPELQAMIVAHLLTDIFEARKRRLISPGMVVVEEAHNYIPERAQEVQHPPIFCAPLPLRDESSAWG